VDLVDLEVQEILVVLEVPMVLVDLGHLEVL
jgi:hypothetical protein